MESKPDAASLDRIDLALLASLQPEARLSSAELSRRLDISSPAIQKRLKKLEDSGVVRSYAAILDREALGFDLLCFVQVSLAQHGRDEVLRFRDRVVALPHVLECYHVTGESDYLLKVVVRNRRALEHFLVHELSPLEGVARVRTSIALNEVKATTELPLVSEEDWGSLAAV